MKLGNIYILIGALCVLLLLVLALKLLNSLWLKPKRSEKTLTAIGFNGNSYKPWQGDMKEVMNMIQEAQSKPISFSHDILPRVVPHFVETIKKYGKNSFIWQGQRPSVLIMDPELIKEVFVQHTTFRKPGGLLNLLITGITSYEGEKWAKHRKIITPAFSIEKIKLMLPAFDLSVGDMLSKWEAIVSQKGSGELDVWPQLQTLTCDVISRTAFGSNYQEGIKIFELQKEMTEHFSMYSSSTLFNIPGARLLPTERNKRIKYIEKVINETIRGIICKRLKAMEEGEASKDDLLGMLLECNKKEIRNYGNKKFGLSIQEVINECRLFYFAGAETTAVMLVWTLILLARYQEWQSRAREEVLKQFGSNRPNFEGLNHLKIVTMILNESLRLYPPIINLARKVRGGAKIGTASLPESTVTLPIILLHHDPKIWGDDVKEFKPERFAEGVSNATKGQAAVYLPFAWGPRMCLGQNFTMVEGKLALARILQNFSFELSPSYSHAPFAVATLNPQHGAHLILHKLK